MRALILLVLSFAFISSDAAALLQFQNLRMLAFAAAVALLCGTALVKHGTIDGRQKTVPVLLVLLLALILLLDVSGPVDPVDYKIVLPVIVLLAAPNIDAALGEEHDAVRLVYGALGLYVVLTFVLAFTAVPAPLMRGHQTQLRWDFTGSLVGHSGLCIVFTLTALAKLREATSDLRRLVQLGALALALVMVFLTATRTALVTLAIFAVLVLAASRRPGRTAATLVLGSLTLAAALALHTLMVSNAFVDRLSGSDVEDFSSGRWDSQVHWLMLGADHPLGLGLGAVRDMLSDGRPAIDGTHLLEWPHNELLRAWIEAGPIGLAFVGLLVGSLLRRAVACARDDTDGPRRTLALAIVSDMLAQCLLQNYFNGIYHATALIMVLAVLLARVERERRGSDPPRRDAGIARREGDALLGEASTS